jgi:NTE family protein
VSTKLSISLALSGGGIRAMLFHLGVLRLLSERGMLENVQRISTVSGGSLLVGVLLQENQLQWPTSEKFLSEIYPKLREKLCRRSLQWGAVRQLLSPWNWRFILSRSNLLALALQKEWGVRGLLRDLPRNLDWSINGTTAENGKRFRFKQADIGDYALGYARSVNFPLASAIAVSAAFPGGFGPLELNTDGFEWKKREWDAPIGSEASVDLGFKKLHLYDGGVYDNLGLEPFFDSGRGTPKQLDSFILVSDAGAPLPIGFSLMALNPFRLKRVADIMADQSHALRVRAFHHYLQKGDGRGALLYIGTPVETEWPCKSAAFAAGFSTTLRRIDMSEFDRISEHGYRVAMQMSLAINTSK